MPRTELADFLRTRRDRLTPADVGVPAGQRRRTPGLRRDEVARLAHMSVDYYTRLEQARGPRPSSRILGTLAEALHLSWAERTHLFRLAGAGATPLTGPVRRVRPHVTAMLHRIPGTAALVTDATYSAIAWNPLAEALLEGLRDEPNLARRHFLRIGPDENSETEAFGPIAAARLRAASARYPDDEPLSRLLAELFASSDEFRELWGTHPVHAPGHRRKVLAHPELGRLRVNCDVLPIEEDDQQLVLVTADPGSPAAEVFARLPGRDGS
ncbi:transcriptional regulator with XRE-family HTH domain [Actinopolyspora biskrensis]|uniref:Transcriptional regulator with XRE-family HTH domain n=1 Tax=Actinopolyspora biskrensis TaxID=1470178 RepID=A0A852YVY6_9ACTN|nr:helix-turn-helix transcriptional regulator [Actinopolyspora biskrensis]NYH78801.1 transcriptional regulator with XRE-family HTH domain [Actinopolyspora biskrensis]